MKKLKGIEVRRWPWPLTSYGTTEGKAGRAGSNEAWTFAYRTSKMQWAVGIAWKSLGG